MRYRIVYAIMLVAASLAAADDHPRFEVATLKQSPPPEGDSISINLGGVRGNRLQLTNVTLSDCIKFAWGLPSDELLSGPDWIKSKAVLFDIVAQVPPGTPHDRLLLMTQALLEDRLQLKLHHEQKEMRYLELLVAKGGSKMPLADLTQTRNNSGGNGHITGNQAPTSLIATLISRFEHVLVFDHTGLDGLYQVKLLWTAGTGGPEMPPDANETEVSLFAAIQEQLGLRLESHKGPVDVLVIDHAEKVPADN